MERKLKTSVQTDLRIQEIMIQLLQNKDYEKITVAEIAKKAEINRTTFYLFYSSKEELIYSICDTFLDEYIETFMESLYMNNSENEKEIYLRAFQSLKKHSKVLKAIWSIHFEEFDPYSIMELSITKTVYQFLQKKNIEIKGKGSREFFSQLYAANVMATVKWWIYNHDDYDANFVYDVIKHCQDQGIFKLLEQ